MEEEEDSKKQEALEQKEESEDKDSLVFDTKTPSIRIQNNHCETLIIGDKYVGVSTRRRLMFQEQALISLVEPKTFTKSSKNNDWINAMNDKLNQIEKKQTWELVPRPKGMNLIGIKWIFNNKFNEDGQVIRNKGRLVCKGYAQIEGIEFE